MAKRWNEVADEARIVKLFSRLLCFFFNGALRLHATRRAHVANVYEAVCDRTAVFGFHRLMTARTLNDGSLAHAVLHIHQPIYGRSSAAPKLTSSAYHLLIAIEKTLLDQAIHTPWPTVRDTLKSDHGCSVILQTNERLCPAHPQGRNSSAGTPLPVPR